MSIKIHHGPPGSYKTSGAVMDDFIPAAKAGRVVITNVRGLSDRDKIERAIGELPESFELVYLPTHESENSAVNRDYLARFFHWAPKGAFLLIDEAQDIFPRAWGARDLDLLNYPGGIDAAAADKRPSTFLQAFEMHRHHGWDMVLTTPNIKKIRDDIRGCAEGAYKHKNLALIGIKGYYVEGFHMADDTGGSASDFLSIRRRKIKKQVWDLYASTATGAHSDTIAGTSLLLNPRVLGFIGIMAACGFWFASHPLSGGIFSQSKSKPGSVPVVEPGSVPAPVPPVSPAPAPAVHDGVVPVRSSASVSPPLDLATFRIYGETYNGDFFRVMLESKASDGSYRRYRHTDLMSLGYSLERLRKCLLKVDFPGLPPAFINCDRFQEPSSSIASASAEFPR